MARWPIVFIAIFLCLAMGDETVRHWLRFDRDAILAGEVWRIFTCHWVHLGWVHAGLNSAGMLLVAWLLPQGHWKYWLGFWLFASIWTTIGVWLDERTAFYVGASGVLHGVLILSAWYSRWLEDFRRYLMLIIIAGKLIWEQTSWYDDGQLMDVIGGHVVVNSHLFGGLTAYAIIVVVWLRNIREQKRSA